MASQISTVATHSVRCARSLLSILPLQRRPNSVLLFALAPSLTTPPEVLSEITTTLTQLHPEHVGCISAPLPYQYLDPNIRGGPHSCSLAYALVHGVSFRSTISGTAQAQVGRWHAARQRTEDSDKDSRMRCTSNLVEPGVKVNWEDAWDYSASPVPSSSNYVNFLDPEALPDGLKNLDPSAIHNILYFSDNAPEGLTAALEGAFPQANKLSLIASSTPFITGRAVTLFRNGSVFSDGAVGVAFNYLPSSPPPVVELSFPSLVTLSTDLNVTSSEGNMIISLDSANPTQLLLNAIQKHKLASLHTKYIGKEDEFYIGVIDPPSQQLSQLHRINAGNPSRGALALEAASAPKMGTVVRLYHLPRYHARDAQRYIPDSISNSISLFVAPEMTAGAALGNGSADGMAPDSGSDRVVVPNAFLAASENGFTFSRCAQGPWKCVVSGGRTGLLWNKNVNEY